jgi:superfamily II DNA or RNA helicase
VVEDSFSHKQWPNSEPIILRDYQVEIINRFLKNPQCIQEVATGAGKTIMTAALSASVQHLGRSIVIVPSKSLVTQTETDYKTMGLDVGVLFGDRKEYTKQHTICTWQSLNALVKNTKNYEADVTIHDFIENVVCVMVDEAHSAKADALKSMLTTIFARVPIRWGLTGTVPKEDYAYQALNCCIGPVIGQLSASELQEQGHLSNCHVNVIQMVDYVEYKDYQQELRYLLETDDRLDYIANLINKISETGNTLVLVDRVDPGKKLTSKIKNAVFVSGATKSKARKDEYDEFAITDDKVAVATYGVAAVGINIPRIFNLVLVESGKSFTRVIQSIGRGIRKAEDKDFVQIWDITSTCKFAKRHLTKRKQFYKEANYPFSIEKTEWQS